MRFKIQNQHNTIINFQSLILRIKDKITVPIHKVHQSKNSAEKIMNQTASISKVVASVRRDSQWWRSGVAAPFPPSSPRLPLPALCPLPANCSNQNNSCGQIIPVPSLLPLHRQGISCSCVLTPDQQGQMAKKGAERCRR